MSFKTTIHNFFEVFVTKKYLTQWPEADLLEIGIEGFSFSYRPFRIVPYCNFQTWRTFHYARGGLTKQDQSLEVQKNDQDPRVTGIILQSIF